ncbi:hypothetical protein Vafri_7461 [Volvox africanus]|uniref:PNPLA domain-containing protein n=1 Tax=Volvox africanus TaxID=51714 RepID=A0A8J4EX02_9CHLO|nr:hypothetical protein Vafri_7461 [Volvox africanus]
MDFGLLPKVQMAGASAGSLAVATYNCGLDPEKATQAMHAFADDCRSKGTRYRLGGLLRDFLHAYLPDDAHERCRGNTHIALTRLFPVVRSEVSDCWHQYRRMYNRSSAASKATSLGYIIIVCRCRQ